MLGQVLGDTIRDQEGGHLRAHRNYPPPQRHLLGRYASDGGLACTIFKTVEPRRIVDQDFLANSHIRDPSGYLIKK